MNIPVELYAPNLELSDISDSITLLELVLQHLVLDIFTNRRMGAVIAYLEKRLNLLQMNISHLFLVATTWSIQDNSRSLL